MMKEPRREVLNRTNELAADTRRKLLDDLTLFKVVAREDPLVDRQFYLMKMAQILMQAAYINLYSVDAPPNIVKWLEKISQKGAVSIIKHTQKVMGFKKKKRKK